MGTEKPRTIVVDGQTYIWKFTPRYERTEDGGWICHDQFAAYLSTTRRAPLRMHFITWESPITGVPLRTGDSIDLGNPSTSGVNLHQPKFAALLIKEGLRLGWQPDSTKGLEIKDGLELVKEIARTYGDHVVS